MQRRSARRHTPAHATASRSEVPTRSRATGSRLQPLGACIRRRVTMNRADSRPTELLLELEREYRSRLGKGRTMSRRRLLGSISGNTVVAAVGIGGLLELLASRDAIAAGTQITIDGVTREPDEEEETPHRHLFTVTFQVFSVSPTAIMGSVNG